MDRGARADRDRARDRPAGRPRDRRAAALPRLGRDRLPLARARGDDALGRRGAADPPRDPDRLEPGRRPLHPRRALDRPAPARQREADRHARAPARPRQHGDRRRARRGHDPRRRPRRRPRARAPASTGARSSPRAPPKEIQRQPGSLTGQFLSGEREIAVPEHRRNAARRARRPRRPPAQPQGTSTSSFPLGVFTCRHRRLGLGQVDARQRDPLPLGRQPPAPRAAAARRPRPHRRDRAGRQDHQHRPVADRAHAALEPGHLHRPLRPHPQALLGHPRGAGARLQAGPVLASTSRAGAARSAGATARSRSRCTSCPTSTCPASSATARRYNRETLEVRYKGKSIADVLEMSVGEAVEFFEPIPKIARRLQTLHDVGLDYIRLGQPATTALGRRGAAGQARHRALEGRHRRHALHPRRADHRACTSPTSSACSRCSTGSSSRATRSS